LGNPWAKRSRKVPDGPPAKTRSSALGVNERGVDRKSKGKSGSTKNSNQARRPMQEPARELAMYDGTVPVGFITVTGGEFAVILPNGTVLGVFRSLKAASAAISAAHGCHHA
jgi:hypothetical protein